MSIPVRPALLGAALFFGATFLISAQTHPAPDMSPQGPTSLPDAPGKQTVQKVCSPCHSPNIVLGRGLTREQWGQVVASMISRGAKGSPQEMAQVVDYLTANLPPKSAASPRGRTTPAGAKRRGGGGGLSAGPDNKQIVDAEAANRGRKIYVAECVTCHGPMARGTNQGADLVRSLTVLHDRYGSEIGPFLKKGHPMQSGASSANFTQAQIEDLSHFLHQKMEDTLRSGPYNKVLNVLTGDATAGRAYFNGAGKCSSCHSPTGDLAGIAKKYDPPTLQIRMLFPRTLSFGRGGGSPPKPTMVTVTPPSGSPVKGELDKIDDFTVSLRDASGQYHSWTRTPDLKVEKDDPYAAHIELLDQYTDKDIHDLVAYLETLK